MKKRILTLLLTLLMALSLLPVFVFSADETLFERYIPINQAYSANVSPYSVTVGKAYSFGIGTQFRNENTNLMFSAPLKRKDLQGCYFKLNYLGTFGSLDKKTMMTAFSLYEND